MSKSWNQVTLVGHIGAQPEVKEIPSGGKVANFSVATSRQWKDGKGEKVEKTEWTRIVAWSQAGKSGLADIVEKYAGKGDRIFVQGRLETRKWQDKDGNDRWTTEVVATDVLLLGNKSSAETATAPATPKKPESWDDFPAALDNDDDIPLPF